MNILNIYRNGNYSVALFSDGTKARVLNSGNEFKPEFPENIDMKISNKCNIGCPFCHENSKPEGNIADFEKWKPFLKTLHAGTELALGGGAISSIPSNDFQKFLEFLKEIDINANITINQKELEDSNFLESIKNYIRYKLIRGIGISFIGRSAVLEELIRRYKNRVVIHVINGIVSKEDITYLASLNCKILVLGYKNFGRGLNYLNKFDKIIESNQKFIKDNILEIAYKFKSVSFDCLAVEQLDLNHRIDEDDWDRLYMGDDGSHTMYIDLVEGTYGINSTSPRESRQILNPTDKIEDIFKNVRSV